MFLCSGELPQAGSIVSARTLLLLAYARRILSFRQNLIPCKASFVVKDNPLAGAAVYARARVDWRCSLRGRASRGGVPGKVRRATSLPWVKSGVRTLRQLPTVP